jgi:hypothetical protein
MHSDFFMFPFLPMLGFGLLYLIGLAIWIWALIETIKSGESDGTKIAWVLVLIFVPVIGLIIWLIAGPRAKKS